MNNKNMDYLIFKFKKMKRKVLFKHHIQKKTEKSWETVHVYKTGKSTTKYERNSEKYHLYLFQLLLSLQQSYLFCVGIMQLCNVKYSLCKF